MHEKKIIIKYWQPMGTNALSVLADALEILKKSDIPPPYNRLYTVNGFQSLPGTAEQMDQWRQTLDQAVVNLSASDAVQLSDKL